MTDRVQRPSPNHDERPGDGSGGGIIDMLVIHYTGMTSAAAAVDWLCAPESKVSAHYLIDDAGAVTQMVDESQRAWHAGVSSWRGETDVNGRSIGIELANPGHEFGYRPFPEAQLAALIGLGREIVGRHPIPPGNVVGHSDVAPGRKVDPGELFPWHTLAAAGLGVWPSADAIADAPSDDIEVALMACGYGLGQHDAATVIEAFQRHFHPNCLTGQADTETGRRAWAVAKCGRDD